MKNDSLASLFILLKLAVFAEKYHKNLKLRFPKKAEDFALDIQKIDKYLGYIGWAEIYIGNREKRKLGVDVLRDLIEEFPQNSQAYLRLWGILMLNKDYKGILELAERLFLFGAGYSSLEIK